MKLIEWIYEKEIKKAIDVGSPERIYHSSKTNKKANYYITYFFTEENKPYLLAEGYSSHYIHCKKWDGEKHTIAKDISFKESLELNIQIRRYYKSSFKVYRSGYRFALEHATGFFYIWRWYKIILGTIKQKLHNRKKLETENSMRVLKNFKRLYDEEYSPMSAVDYMIIIYGDLSLKRQDFRIRQAKLDLVINHLVQEGMLQQNGTGFKINGKGLSALINHEDEERKQRNMVTRERIIISLTAVLAFSALIQSGLLKLPTLLDLAK